MIFKGSGVALVTPFTDDNQVDYECIDKLVNYHIEHKTDAIISMGTTGEASTATDKEQIGVIERCVKAAGGRIPVIAGTGINNTSHSVFLSKEAERVGADALLIVTPYYNKSTARGLYEHFKYIAENVKIPLILYTVPGRTAVQIPVSLVKELSEIKNIVGIKDATGNLSYTCELKRAVDKDFAIYSGNDDVAVPLMSVGGSGVISVSANIIPQETHDMMNFCLEGDFKSASEMQIKNLGLIKALFAEVNPVPIKAAMELLGLCKGSLRLPLTYASVETVNRLKTEMSELGILS